MTGLIKSARQRLDPRCLITGSLDKDGCNLDMTGAPRPRLVVDFDKPGSPLAADVTRCDYLLIAEGGHTSVWAAPIELKRGKVHAGQIVRQLRAGASVAEKLVCRNAAVRFQPIAAAGSISKHERNKLREKANRIRFHEHSEPIRLMSCGTRLVEALRP